MHGQQQRVVVLRQRDQLPADQRAVRQVEGRQRLLAHQPRQRLLARRGGLPGQVAQAQREADTGRVHALHRLPVQRHEAGSQHLVPRHDPVQRAPQRGDVEPAVQPQPARHVIGRAGAFHLREEPQALLGERQGQRAVTIGRHDRRQVAARGTRHRVGQPGQLGMREQLAQRQLRAQALAQLRDQPHRQQRMAAELEEVVVAADPLHPEQVLPQRGQQRFDLTARRRVGAARVGLRVGQRQGAAVELAVRRERQRRQPDEGGRHHVRRQAGLQARAQRLGLDRRAGAVGHQPRLLASRPMRDHDRLGLAAPARTSCAAISSSSTRKPRILTWKSLRPR